MLMHDGSVTVVSKETEMVSFDLSRRDLLRATAASAITMTGSVESATTGSLVLADGDFWTNDTRQPTVRAVGIRDGLIVATGDVGSVRRRLPSAEVIDMKGATIVPGLIDSHTHVVRGGRSYTAELRWDGVTSLERGLSMITEQARRTPKGQWIRVIGSWSPYQFTERRLPTPDELSRAAPDTPVFVCFLYSRGYLNRAGVAAVGLTDVIAADAPTGARYDLRSEGAVIYADPNPALLYALIAKLPPLSPADQIASTRSFFRELNRFGITGVVDAGGGGHSFPDDYHVAEKLAIDGELPLRISYDLFPQRAGRELEDFTAWTRDYKTNRNLAAQLEHGFEIEGAGEYLTTSAGDFENFLAVRPDLDSRPGWRAELTAVTRKLLQSRWRMRIHATYNESITHILDVFEAAHAAERAAGRPGFTQLRWAIDHAETIDRKNIQRVKRLGGGISVQNRMAFAGEYFAERYGSEAASSAPPLRDILDAGVPMGGGTDATRVSGFNPWLAIQWLVTGATLGGTVLMSERHRLTRAEALRAWTSGSAWFAGEDSLKGSIAPGRYADLAVLSDNVFKAAPERIGRVESVMTMTAGRIVYAAGEFRNLAPAPLVVSPTWSPVATYGGYQAIPPQRSSAQF